MSKRVKQFNDLYNLNKHKICMPNSGSYTINKESVTEYINSNCVESSHDMFNFIFNNIRYITFNEFYDKLTKYIIKVNKVHRSEDEDLIINAYLITYCKRLDTSNFWVSFLIKKIIEDNNIRNFNIVDIVYSIEDIPSDLNSMSNIVIFADDCAYSGNQSGEHLFDRPLHFACKLYVVIPYICNYAYAIYKSKIYNTYKVFPENIIFIEECIDFIESFTELCIKNNFNMFEKDVYYLNDESYNSMNAGRYFSINSLVNDILALPTSGTLIYFDHKIADQLSTIQYFLNYSVVLNNVYILTDLNKNFEDTLFNTFKLRYSQYNEIYFNKPINIIKEEFTNIDNKRLLTKIMTYLGDTYYYKYHIYVKDYATFQYKNTGKGKVICNNNEEIQYYNVINNCEKKSKYIPSHGPGSTAKLAAVSCPGTFYKQRNFYTLPEVSGGYYKKYIQAKKTYIYLKQKN